MRRCKSVSSIDLMVTTRHVSCPCQGLSAQLEKKRQELEASGMRREDREFCSMLLLNTAFGRFYQDLSSKIYHQDLSQEYGTHLAKVVAYLQDRASDMPSQAMFFSSLLCSSSCRITSGAKCRKRCRRKRKRRSRLRRSRKRRKRRRKRRWQMPTRRQRPG